MKDILTELIINTVSMCIEISDQYQKECAYFIYKAESGYEIGAPTIGEKNSFMIWEAPDKTPVAMIHTHLTGPAYPSIVDRRFAMAVAAAGNKIRLFVSDMNGEITEYTKPF